MTLVGSPAFPDDQQLLLLRAALLDGEDAMAAWVEWQQRTGGVEHHDPASFRLLPLLYRNLLSLGVDDPALSKLRGAYRYAWYCNQRLFHEAAGVIGDLGTAGIESLALKGAALTILYYDDYGTRPMDDLDLLVHFADAGRALDVLGRLGWQIDSTLPPEKMLLVRHAVPCRDRTGRELDLHWGALYQPASDDRFWAQSIEVEVRGQRTRALCPAHQLIHVCVHGLSLFPAPVRWIADAFKIIHASPTLDWDEVVGEAQARRVTLAMVTALRYLEQAFAVPVPSEALTALERSRPGFDERLAHRAATHGSRAAVQRSRLFLIEWFRYRRLRRLDPRLAPPSFVVHLQYAWGLPSRRRVVGRLLSKVLSLVRYDGASGRAARRRSSADLRTRA